ncbi:MAG: hypothetical protein AAF495_27510 [Pseudomonadota bacterium]
MSSLRVLRIFSLVGLALFGGALLVILLAPAQVERAAKAFLVAEVKAEVKDALESPKTASAKAIYQSLQEKLAAQSAATRAALEARFAEKIAAMIAKLCKLDCEASNRLAQAIQEGFKAQLAKLQTVTLKVKDLAQAKYDKTLDKLLRELTIFTGSTAAVFAVLLAASYLRRDYGGALALPAWLLFASTAIACGVYLFGQNWFYTILFDDYVGYGYPAYLGLIFLFLLDVVFNSAQITLFLVELIASILGAIARALSACLPG